MEICRVLKINNSKIFSQNFINYSLLFICKKKSFNHNLSDILLVGSNTSLNNRIISANYMHENKKVISFCHAHSDSNQLDDPVTGYGEYSYCTDYVTFGSSDFIIGNYNNPLHKYPKFHYRSSKFIEKVHVDPIIKMDHNLNNFKALYIPTNFSNNVRYGPFRDIDDADYKQWQSCLLKHKNIFYKPYPGQEEYMSINKSKIEKGRFDKIIFDLKKYDFFIIDFFQPYLLLFVLQINQYFI